MNPPHYRTPDYPRSNLGAYMAQVMQLFDPECEGAEVSKVEQKCSKLWTRLTANEQAVAITRVQILYSLFGQHAHTPLLEGKDLAFEDWYLRIADLTKDPKEQARAAWRDGQKFYDKKLAEEASRARRRVLELEDDISNVGGILSDLKEAQASGVTLHPAAYAQGIDKALTKLGWEDEED